MVEPDLLLEVDPDTGSDDRLWMSCKQLENPKASQDSLKLGNKPNADDEAITSGLDCADTNSSCSRPSSRSSEEWAVDLDSSEGGRESRGSLRSCPTGDFLTTKSGKLDCESESRNVESKTTEDCSVGTDFWRDLTSTEHFQASDGEIEFPAYGNGGTTGDAGGVKNRRMEAQHFYHYDGQ